ncbi:MAG: hypothetical protein ACREOU_04410, partial [Candidatus Eiseniibacteriota bacterium]
HGSGTARGLALDLGLSGTRFGILASYGVQHARLTGGGTTYAPSHSATHFLEGGLTLHPSATASIRLGVAAALGRRTTPVDGSFQWEAHNLLDRGAEFVGSPNQDTGALGAAALPGYLRLDLGVRKHWHFDLGGRDVALGVFGTMTNLLGRENVLTYARDPSTGQRTRILMRPRAPLVVGLDWRF